MYMYHYYNHNIFWDSAQNDSLFEALGNCDLIGIWNIYGSGMDWIEVMIL